MNQHYNQNYTREEIDAVLAKIKSCVENNKYIISQNENRNRRFLSFPSEHEYWI